MTISQRGSAKRRAPMPRKCARAASRPRTRPTGRSSLASEGAKGGFAFRATAARRAAASFRSSRVGKGSDRQEDSRASGLRNSLAQPPDITETFVREVDENLRRDRDPRFFQGQRRAALIGAADPVPGGRPAGSSGFSSTASSVPRPGRAACPDLQGYRHRQHVEGARSSWTISRTAGSKGVRAHRAFHPRGVRASAERHQNRDRHLQADRERQLSSRSLIATRR